MALSGSLTAILALSGSLAAILALSGSCVVKLTTASVALQEISSLESELVNLEAEIQMQRENMEVKEVVMKKLKEKMDQVAAV